MDTFLNSGHVGIAIRLPSWIQAIMHILLLYNTDTRWALHDASAHSRVILIHYGGNSPAGIVDSEEVQANRNLSEWVHTDLYELGTDMYNSWSDWFRIDSDLNQSHWFRVHNMPAGRGGELKKAIQQVALVYFPEC